MGSKLQVWNSQVHFYVICIRIVNRKGERWLISEKCLWQDHLRVKWGQNKRYKDKYIWNPDGSGECKFKCHYDIPSEGPKWVSDSSQCPKCRPNWAFDIVTGHCRPCPCHYLSRASFEWDQCASCPNGYELDNFECRKICRDVNSHPVQSDIRIRFIDL